MVVRLIPVLLGLEVADAQIAHRLDALKQFQVFLLLDIFPVIRAVITWLPVRRLFTRWAGRNTA
ncbi:MULTISPECIES: hypothetical protein [Pseudomonas]|uniref:Uncharacterized protein n=2 Tax=Pseudomonas fragariae (ex Marin et al. 2024) TaxID=3080056 RepID=A0ABT3LIV7_9PSED|nr:MULTISPECIES: hypothetical protein [Pseudomonas]MCW6056358.1 hypothetical protein [Pseudomonas fragi]KWS13804.1 hypothetical protein AL063_11695 [Pseudomonas syringae pv. syringae]MCH5498798.1 hypothetical protein [Pseudomonas syringae pv. syringae]MCH5525175.1 hypothetical protein [Pseudomonas syringae pv. syringae]MCH5560173.1 hypothetical protein [Pseudomonas syringae pv. syringae]